MLAGETYRLVDKALELNGLIIEGGWLATF